jgi:hypothetical protein
MARSGKERAASPTPTETGSTITTTASTTPPKKDALLLKKGSPKVAVPSPFHGDRSKFNAYVLQIRLYWWADRQKLTKPIDTRELPLVRDQIVWAASYLRRKAEARFRPYLEDKLINGERCKPKTREVFQTTINYLAFLSILYGDLNEVRTTKLKFNKLK